MYQVFIAVLKNTLLYCSTPPIKRSIFPPPLLLHLPLHQQLGRGEFSQSVSQHLMTTKIMKSVSNETLNIFSTESSGPPTFWILPKLYELCKPCYRNPLETLE